MSAIKLGLFGAGGRMGSEIATLANEDKVFRSTIAISRSSDVQGFLRVARKIDSKLAEGADVWIDFSLPTAFDEILSACLKARRPLVSGTTGLSREQLQALKKAGQKIPILWSSNMSLGIVALKKAMGALSVLNDFDFQIEELHHRRKKDRPSGTALTLQERLIEVTGLKKIPAPISIRGGGIFGIHKIYAMSEEEVLVLEHQALNRKVFARGALWAAQKLINQPPAFYQLEDLIQWP